MYVSVRIAYGKKKHSKLCYLIPKLVGIFGDDCIYGSLRNCFTNENSASCFVKSYFAILLFPSNFFINEAWFRLNLVVQLKQSPLLLLAPTQRKLLNVPL